MPNRLETIDFIVKTQYYYYLNTKSELNDFINNINLDSKVLIIDAQETKIPIQEWRSYLNENYFFFALPGTKMPLCHNLVEALSCGCIPIIYKEYALLLSPELVHLKNALVYGNLESLETLMDQVFKMSQIQVEELTSNCSDYYKNYLNPYAVVGNIENKTSKQLFLQAEYNSVKFT